MTTLPLRQLFSFLFLAFIGLLAATALQAWTGPSETAPNGNVAAPINVGTVDQVKSAGISVDALAVFGSQYIENKLGIGRTSPVTALDVNGTLRLADGGEVCQAVTAGSIRFNAASTAMEYCDGTAWTAFGGGSSFGAWASKSADTVYQASTDGFVSVAGLTPSGDMRRCIAYGYTDSSNPPATIRVQDGSEDNSGSGHFWAQRHGFTMPVRSGDYWKVTSSGSCTNTVHWIPIESSGGSGSGGGSVETGTRCRLVMFNDVNAQWPTCRRRSTSWSSDYSPSTLVNSNDSRVIVLKLVCGPTSVEEPEIPPEATGNCGDWNSSFYEGG